MDLGIDRKWSLEKCCYSRFYIRMGFIIVIYLWPWREREGNIKSTTELSRRRRWNRTTLCGWNGGFSLDTVFVASRRVVWDK